jgi:homocysteine S-methyltransferase
MLARGEFVVSMQIDPPKGTDFEAVLGAVRTFRDSGRVHSVDINSNPLAHLHLDSLWMALACEREGVETIPHVTPRDASLMGLCGNLLGAWSLGIRNVLVITGDPSQRGDRAGSSDVYQTDSIGLVKVIRDLNDGKDAAGNPIGNPPNFLIGVAVNPNEPDLDREVDRFRRKVDHGADFAMTQVFFEWDCWERFLDRFGGKLPIPAIVAVWPLTSHKLALRIHHEVPGIVVADPVLARLERAGAGAREEGFAIAREILAESRRRAQGAYVIAPFKNPASALELL